MNWQKGLWYLFYAIVFFAFLIFAQHYYALFDRMMSITFHMTRYILSSQLVLIPVGLILGLEHFVREWKRKGTWRLNIWKIIFLALPMVCLAFSPLLSYYFHLPFNLIYQITFWISPCAPVFLGFFTLTSFFKEENY